MLTRRRILIAAAAFGLCLVLLALPLLRIRMDTGARLTGDPSDVSHHQVALVLGAGLNSQGGVNWFLRDRMNGAIRLYRAGKVDGLLLSGDNHVTSYDEPAAMKTYALSQGVPAAAITVDDAGFNTYDSCYRAHAVFGVTSAEIVTQGYHLPRAVYLCRSLGIDADGLSVPDWGKLPTTNMVHYQVREVLADVKAMWDADVTHPSPRYLGPHVHLNLQPAA
jgi:vancomycin permeability regulator SanA